MAKNSCVCSNKSLFSDIYKLSSWRQYFCTNKTPLFRNYCQLYNTPSTIVSSILPILKNVFLITEKREQSYTAREITHLTPIYWLIPHHQRFSNTPILRTYIYPELSLLFDIVIFRFNTQNNKLQITFMTYESGLIWPLQFKL